MVTSTIIMIRVIWNIDSLNGPVSNLERKKDTWVRWITAQTNCVLYRQSLLCAFLCWTNTHSFSVNTYFWLDRNSYLSLQENSLHGLYLREITCFDINCCSIKYLDKNIEQTDWFTQAFVLYYLTPKQLLKSDYPIMFSKTCSYINVVWVSNNVYVWCTIWISQDNHKTIGKNRL